ncbi:MAG: hypothetical protein KDE50_34625, partial [Caldilineaceae bacterium]|nr:hypothetical protein [Caldilineaceae bacterium]
VKRPNPPSASLPMTHRRCINRDEAVYQKTKYTQISIENSDKSKKRVCSKQIGMTYSVPRNGVGEIAIGLIY